MTRVVARVAQQEDISIITDTAHKTHVRDGLVPVALCLNCRLLGLLLGQTRRQWALQRLCEAIEIITLALRVFLLLFCVYFVGVSRNLLVENPLRHLDIVHQDAHYVTSNRHSLD